MPICYVVQESQGKNLLPARDHGEIQVMLTEHDVRKGLHHCTLKLREKMADFRCDKDFLILIGDPVFMGIAMVFASEMSEGDFQILRWDRERYKYDPIDIRL
jgi:hypothetical protein